MKNATTKDITGLVVDLPDALQTRIESERAAMQQRIQQAQQDCDRTVKTLLEGFLAALPATDGKRFNLSDDGRMLVEASADPTPYP